MVARREGWGEGIVREFGMDMLLCSVAVISTILSSRSFICFPTSVSLLLIPSSVLFISFVCPLVLVGL